MIAAIDRYNTYHSLSGLPRISPEFDGPVYYLDDFEYNPNIAPTYLDLNLSNAKNIRCTGKDLVLAIMNPTVNLQEINVDYDEEGRKEFTQILSDNYVKISKWLPVEEIYARSMKYTGNNIKPPYPIDTREDFHEGIQILVAVFCIYYESSSNRGRFIHPKYCKYIRMFNMESLIDSGNFSTGTYSLRSYGRAHYNSLVSNHINESADQMGLNCEMRSFISHASEEEKLRYCQNEKIYHGYNIDVIAAMAKNNIPLMSCALEHRDAIPKSMRFVFKEFSDTEVIPLIRGCWDGSVEMIKNIIKLRPSLRLSYMKSCYVITHGEHSVKLFIDFRWPDVNANMDGIFYYSEFLNRIDCNLNMFMYDGKYRATHVRDTKEQLGKAYILDDSRRHLILPCDVEFRDLSDIIICNWDGSFTMIAPWYWREDFNLVLKECRKNHKIFLQAFQVALKMDKFHTLFCIMRLSIQKPGFQKSYLPREIMEIIAKLLFFRHYITIIDIMDACAIIWILAIILAFLLSLTIYIAYLAKVKAMTMTNTIKTGSGRDHSHHGHRDHSHTTATTNDIAIWKDNGVTHVAEMYPGAFKTVNFKHDEKDVKHEYDDYIKELDDMEYTGEITGNVLCIINSCDNRIHLEDARELAKANNVDLFLMSDVMNGTTSVPTVVAGAVGTPQFREILHFERPTIIFGDTRFYNKKFKCEVNRYFMRPDYPFMLSEMNFDKITPKRYIAYIENRKHVFKNTRWLGIGDIDAIIQNELLPQIPLKAKYKDKIFVHITGPAGIGKTTLCNDLNKNGIKAFDTDDITDSVRSDEKSIPTDVYKRLEKIIDDSTVGNNIIVFCGLSLELSLIAKYKILLHDDFENIYLRILQRTVNTIYDSKIDIDAAVADKSLTNPHKYREFCRKHQIRFPGFIPPDMHLYDNIVPFYEQTISDGYEVKKIHEVLLYLRNNVQHHL